MKNFARGTRNKLGRSSSKKKEASYKDDEAFNELFAGVLQGSESNTPQDLEDDTINTAFGDDIVLNLPEDQYPSKRHLSFGEETFGDEPSVNHSTKAGRRSREQSSLDGGSVFRGSKGPSGPDVHVSRHDRRGLGVRPGQGQRPELDELSVLDLDGGSRSTTHDFDAGSVSNLDDTEGRMGSTLQMWKDRYRHLKSEYDSLQLQYSKLLESHKQESEEAKRKIEGLRAELQNKEAELADLKQGVREKRRSPMAPDDAEKKIAAQNEEIQKLLEQRISLEAELANLRYSNTSPVALHRPSASGFDYERKINNLNTALREKEEAIHDLEQSLTVARNELARVGGVMGVVAEQMEVDEAKKKKKKGWFGSSKSKKVDTTKLTASEIESARREAVSLAGIPEVSPHPSPRGLLAEPMDVHTGGRLIGLPHQDQAVVTKRVVELERENARLEGEVQILEKEKSAAQEQIGLFKAKVDVLLKAKELDDAETRSVQMVKGLSIPLPLEGGSEGDRLRVMVHVQQGALERLSLKCQKLEAVLRRYTNATGDLPAPGVSDQNVMLLRKELQETRSSLSQAKESQRLLQADYEKTVSSVGHYSDEVQRLQALLDEQREQSAKAIKQLKDELESNIAMIGRLLSQTDRLQTDLSATRQSHINDAKCYQGELRSLRDGRVARLIHDPAHSRVFPSKAERVVPSEQPARNLLVSSVTVPKRNVVSNATIPDLAKTVTQDAVVQNTKGDDSPVLSPAKSLNGCDEKDTTGFPLPSTEEPAKQLRLRPIATVEFNGTGPSGCDNSNFTNVPVYLQHEAREHYTYEALPVPVRATGSEKVSASPALLQWAAGSSLGSPEDRGKPQTPSRPSQTSEKLEGNSSMLPPPVNPVTVLGPARPPASTERAQSSSAGPSKSPHLRMKVVSPRESPKQGTSRAASNRDRTNAKAAHALLDATPKPCASVLVQHTKPAETHNHSPVLPAAVSSATHNPDARVVSTAGSYGTPGMQPADRHNVDPYPQSAYSARPSGKPSSETHAHSKPPAGAPRQQHGHPNMANGSATPFNVTDRQKLRLEDSATTQKASQRPSDADFSLADLSGRSHQNDSARLSRRFNSMGSADLIDDLFSTQQPASVN